RRPCSRSTGWGRPRRRTSTRATESDLTLPRRVGLLAPPRTNRLELVGRQRSGGQQRRILLPAARLRRPDDSGVDARHAQREAQRDAHCDRRVADERIVETAQALPIVRIVGLGWASIAPSDVRQRALGDDTHLARAGQRKRELDRFLIRNADGRLQRVESAALDRVAGRRAVTTVPDRSGQAALACTLERLDGVALLELGERAAVELDQIHVIGEEALQAALDAGQ